VVNLRTAIHYIKKFQILPRQCFYVFCVVTRINRFHLPIRLKLIGFYNRSEKCLIRNSHDNTNKCINVKLISIHIICRNSDMFWSTLIIFRELTNVSTAYIRSGLSTFKNCASYIYIGQAYRYHPDVTFYIFFSTNISTEYFKHAAHSLFISSKCCLFHNANFFGSCIIHILHRGYAKI
jgi:hypothetical protein